jgi:GH25 family lysozyme M1 (1,4-beta-N-acetylmuramidase)
MFLYFLLGLLGIGGGVYVARRVTGRRLIQPGTSVGTGTSVEPSSKLTASDDDARGVDVSAAQGVIDWVKVKAAGIAFVIIKLTEGETGVDGKGAFNSAGATANGIAKGFYHFAILAKKDAAGNYTALDPRVQARFFAAKIKAMGGSDLPPVLDWEHVDSKTKLSPISKAATIQWAKDFADEMRLQGFPKLVIYFYPSYAVQLMPEFASSGLGDIYSAWIADYGQTVGQTGDVAAGAIPAGWKGGTFGPIGQVFKTWMFWQMHGNDNLPAGSGAPRVSGIVPAVDKNRFNGTEKQLQGGLLARVT